MEVRAYGRYILRQGQAWADRMAFSLTVAGPGGGGERFWIAVIAHLGTRHHIATAPWWAMRSICEADLLAKLHRAVCGGTSAPRRGELRRPWPGIRWLMAWPTAGS